MAAAHVLHVGGDDRHRMQVLRYAGYTVDECETLPEMVGWFHAGHKADVVCISETANVPAEAAIAAVRALCRCPVVLFRARAHVYVPQDWDLEVPPLTHPRVWLGELAQLVAMTRANVAGSAASREESRRPREQPGC